MASAHVPLRRWEDWERSRLKKIRRDEKRQRDLARNYPGGYYDPNGGELLRPRVDDASNEQSDTYSMISSGTEDDQWGTQIGAYNENNTAYPPPPATLLIPQPELLQRAQTVGKEELEAMLDQGFVDRTAPGQPRQAPKIPVTRYQLSETHAPVARPQFDGFGPLSPDLIPPHSRAISPISPATSTHGLTSALGSDYKTHVKKRSNSGAGDEDWGPLGPLGANSTGPPSRRL